MFSYKRLFILLVEKEMKKTDLVKAGVITSTTLARLSKNSYVDMTIVDRLCNYFGVPVEKIIEHIPDENKTKHETAKE